MAKKLRWLHLSNLEMDDSGEAPPSWLNAAVLDQFNVRGTCNLLFLSGDIANSGKEASYRIAASFLRAINCRDAGSRNVGITAFMVPGDRDLSGPMSSPGDIAPLSNYITFDATWCAAPDSGARGWLSTVGQFYHRTIDDKVAIFAFHSLAYVSNGSGGVPTQKTGQVTQAAKETLNGELRFLLFHDPSAREGIVRELLQGTSSAPGDTTVLLHGHGRDTEGNGRVPFGQGMQAPVVSVAGSLRSNGSAEGLIGTFGEYDLDERTGFLECQVFKPPTSAHVGGPRALPQFWQVIGPDDYARFRKMDFAPTPRMKGFLTGVEPSWETVLPRQTLVRDNLEDLGTLIRAAPPDRPTMTVIVAGPLEGKTTALMQVLDRVLAPRALESGDDGQQWKAMFIEAGAEPQKILLEYFKGHDGPWLLAVDDADAWAEMLQAFLDTLQSERKEGRTPPIVHFLAAAPTVPWSRQRQRWWGALAEYDECVLKSLSNDEIKRLARSTKEFAAGRQSLVFMGNVFNDIEKASQYGTVGRRSTLGAAVKLASLLERPRPPSFSEITRRFDRYLTRISQENLEVLTDECLRREVHWTAIEGFVSSVRESGKDVCPSARRLINSRMIAVLTTSGRLGWFLTVLDRLGCLQVLLSELEEFSSQWQVFIALARLFDSPGLEQHAMVSALAGCIACRDADELTIDDKSMVVALFEETMLTLGLEDRVNWRIEVGRNTDKPIRSVGVNDDKIRWLRMDTNRIFLSTLADRVAPRTPPDVSRIVEILKKL